MDSSDAQRGVSESNDHDHLSESEDHHSDDQSNNGKNSKPGRKLNPDAQQQRRIQNRVAQREFRLRKQQRIRDLEARVEMLSGSQGQSYEQMRHMMRAIMAENHHLRGLVRQLSEFMSEGIGGCLPKMGFTKESFHDFLNRGETDTAFYAFEEYKKAHQGSGGGASGNLPPLGMLSMENGDSTNKKRKRNSTGGTDGDDLRGGGGATAGGMSNNSTDTPPGLTGGLSYPSTVSSPSNAMQTFSALLDGSYSGQGYPSPQSTMGPQMRGAPQGPYGSAASGPDRSMPPNPNLFSAFNGYDVYALQPPPPPPDGPGIMQLARSPTENMGLLAGVENAIENANPRQLEAGKLIKYHLTNYRNNHNYCLPASLRPTLVQRTIPHDPIIDGIPQPVMRDRLILLKGRYDLVDCMHSFLRATTIHGDDVLAHPNWEISEAWLKRYGFLVDEAVLASTNRWRKERGEKEISYEDLPALDEAPQMPVQPYGAPTPTIGNL